MKRLIIVLITATAISPARTQWTEPVRISQPGAGYYPQIIAQGDTLHVLYENTQDYDKICYLRSSDRGETWSAYRVLSEIGGLTTQPRIMRYGQCLLALWSCYFSHGVYRLNIGYAFSNDNGESWTDPQYVFNPNRADPFFLSASSADSDINIEIIDSPEDYMIFHNVKSTNFGQDWSAPNEIFVSYQSGRPDQVSFNDVVHFTWDGRFDTDHKYEIYYINSTDGGETWSPNFALSHTDQYHSEFSAISVNEIGRLVVTWMDYKNSPYISTGDIFLRQSLDSGGSWGPEQQLTSHHRARRSDIALSGDTIAVAWEDGRLENGQGSIYCTMSFDGGQTFSEPDWVDNDTNYSINPAVAFSNSRAYLIWYDIQYPDSAGLYFARWDLQTNDIRDSNNARIPWKMDLSAYPNPFNSTTIITYKNLEGGEIGIYNINGQKVRTFETTQIKEGQIEWDARDALGNKVSSGIYFARAKGRRNSNTIKLLYLK